jgi:hypothetical protein
MGNDAISALAANAGKNRRNVDKGSGNGPTPDEMEAARRFVAERTPPALSDVQITMLRAALPVGSLRPTSTDREGTDV